VSLILNPRAYRDLIDGDLEWLLKQPRTLERDHIELILRWQHKHAELVIDKSYADRKSDDQP
jgi:hypothetical protein